MTRGPAPAVASVRILHAALVLAALAGCAIEEPAPSAPDPVDPGDPPPPRVLVLNGLSWTISVLDLESNVLTPYVAAAGDVANRFVEISGRNEIAVMASGENEVQFHDAHSLAIVGAAEIGAGSNPYAGTLWQSHVLASNWLSGEIVDIDASTRAVARRLPTSASGPQGIAVAGNLAYVACTHYDGPTDSFLQGFVDVVDLAGWSVAASIPVPLNPQEVHVAPDGRIHVVCTGTNDGGASNGSIAVVNPATRAVEATVPIGGAPARLAFASGDVAWLAGWWGGIRRYDSSMLAVLPSPPDPDLAALDFSAIAWDSAGATIYAASFSMDLLVAIDEGAGTIREAWVVGDGPVDVLVQRP